MADTQREDADGIGLSVLSSGADLSLRRPRTATASIGISFVPHAMAETPAPTRVTPGVSNAANPDGPSRAATPIIGDDFIDEIVTLVLQRLSAIVMQQTVTEIVNSTAERLVQKEIERMRSA